MTVSTETGSTEWMAPAATGDGAPLPEWESNYSRLVQALRSQVHAEEAFTLTLMGEGSDFVRFNQGRVRQTGNVMDCQITLTLMHNQRLSFRTLPLSGNWSTDWSHAQAALTELRQELPQLPEDPYLVLPTGSSTSREIYPGQLLAAGAIAPTILPAVEGLDFTGIYAGGTLLRGYADSAGQQHWFATDSFSLDYSLFIPNGQAIKGTFAGSAWDAAAYADRLAESRRQLDRLAQPAHSPGKGQYRTYLAPAALAEIVSMFSWGGVSEAAMQQGESALALLQRGEKLLSPQFTLQENFGAGQVPRFNDLGEIAPLELPIIQQGRLINLLVNSRTAQEYGKPANGANRSESLRSPEILPGTLAAAEILQALDTGLYVSNLHYLNWSDRSNARITGMTRYACFWVENGEIVAPIQNLRFDETLYRCLGENLIALTDFQEFVPEVGTYDHRNLGGVRVPGALVEGFTYTL